MEKLYSSLNKIGGLSTVFYGNSVLDYIIFVALFIVILLLVKPLIKLLLKFFSKLTSKTNTNVDDYIANFLFQQSNKSLFLLDLSIAFFISITVLTLSPTVQKIVNGLSVILITIFFVTTLIEAIKFIIKSKSSTDNSPHINSFLLLFPVIKLFVWIFAILFIISNLGYSVTEVLAGLGIGGIALALASQSFLSDLISFVSIASDKPIEIGDYISVGGVEGTVKKIGIKSTRLERNMGEEVVLPNSAITGSELHNYKRLDKRRFDIIINVASGMPNEKLQLIPQIAHNICKDNKKIEFVRCAFTNIGNPANEFSIAAYVLDSDAEVYFKEKEQYIYKLKQCFEQNEILLAVPAIIVKQ